MIAPCPTCQHALNFDQALAGTVVACPYCGQQINVNVPVTQQPIKAQPYIPPEQPIVHSRPRRRRSETHPGIAALLSFFIVGAGQMYAGNVLGGMALFLLWVLMLVAAIPTLGISLIFAFILWVASVFLAYTDALGSQRD